MSFRNRIVRRDTVDPRQVKAHPQNWRLHPEAQVKALEGLLDEVGWVGEILWNERTGNLIDGHARIELAIGRDEADVPRIVVDLSEEEERLVLATLDPISALADEDSGKLSELLSGIGEHPALDDLMSKIGKNRVGSTDPDETPAEPEETEIVCGDMFVLGNHRILCGDCSITSDIEKLIGGDRPQLICTSPPYNQSIHKFKPSGMHAEGKTSSQWVDKVRRLSYFDGMHENEYQQWQVELLNSWRRIGTPTCALFYNHKIRYRDKQIVSPLMWIHNSDWNIRQEIIWSRPGSITQNARMFLPSDERIYWCTSGKSFVFNDSIEIKSYSSVWKIGLEPNKAHAVAFPCEIPKRAIEAVTNYGDAVYDPFMGSGTTLIAAEMEGRKCFGMEINPIYIDVAIRRWESFTGKKAHKLQE